MQAPTGRFKRWHPGLGSADNGPMPASAHRLFFALAPTPELVAHIEAAALALGATGAGGRRTRADKLHVTLAFLGDFHADSDALARALAVGAEVAACVGGFDFALDHAFSFPGARPLWLLGGEAAPFATLHAQLLAALAGAGFQLRDAKRAFVPHVTLLRDARKALPHTPITPIDWRARELALYDSDLATGAYRILARWPLR